MATNEVFWNGKDLSLEVGTGIVSGDPVRVGQLNGVVNADDGVIRERLTGNEPGWASVTLRGVFNLSVAITGTPAAGTPVYATITGGTTKVVLTNTSATGRAVFGHLKSKAVAGTAIREVIIGPPSGTVA